MLNITTIDQAIFDHYLNLIKDLIKSRFPEKPRSNNPQGAKRKWPRWLIVALALLKEMLHYNWREFADELSKFETTLIRYGASHAPSYGSIHGAWSDIGQSQLENLIVLFGRMLCPDPNKVAIDSTGFLFKGGSVWILLKWRPSKLKKSSKSFIKAHMIVDTSSKTVLSVKLSKSPTHDVSMAPKVIKKIGCRQLKKINKMYGDKAYNDQKLRNKELSKYEIKLIVEPKSNAVDHGTGDYRDLGVRLYQNSPNLWKYTHKHGCKSSVEQTFGLVKVKLLPLTGRSPKNKRKQILMNFLVYNLNMILEVQNLM